MHIPGVSLEHGGKTAVVTFGETAMNRRFVAWLDSVVAWLEGELSISAVVFTGTRNVFITGADLTEVRQLRDRDDVEDFLRIPHSLMERIFGMEKLTAAAINGHCIGGGLELALVCDFRIAVDLPSPYLGLPEVRLGLVPALGATARLTGSGVAELAGSIEAILGNARLRADLQRSAANWLYSRRWAKMATGLLHHLRLADGNTDAATVSKFIRNSNASVSSGLLRVPAQ